MTYEFIGNVIALSEAQQVNTQSGVKNKWLGVIEHENDGTHQPRRVAFTVWNNENIFNTLNQAIQNNQPAKVTCSVDAREWQGKWYNEIQCFRAEMVASQPMGGYQQQPMQQGYGQQSCVNGYGQPIGQPMPQQGFQAPVAPQQTAPSQQTFAQPAPNNAGGQVQGATNNNNGNLPF